MLEWLFWAIIGLNAVTFAGYPVLIIGLAAIAGRSQPEQTRDTPVEAASIIVCAYNEEQYLEAKLNTLVEQTWPGRTEILIVNDGSSDRTADIADAFAARHPALDIHVHHRERAGKVYALNFALETARHDILVLTDADPLWRPDTLTHLLAPFADPEVGGVVGEVVTSTDDTGDFAESEEHYRRYETGLRAAETALFGCISADGGLYAIRRELAEEVPPGVTDDFFLSTAAVVAHKRLVIEPRAQAIEKSIATGRQQFRRRVRITSRGMASLARRRVLLNPFRYGFYSVGLVFHKLLRRVAPPLLLVLPLLAAALATQHLFYLAVLAGSAAGLGLALLPFVIGKAPKVLMTPHYAVIGIAGLGLGVLHFLSGQRYVSWTPQKSNA